MKITILQGAFLPVPPLRGGAVEKMWFELAAEFTARGHDVVQISRRCDGLPSQETLRGVRHRRVAGADQPTRLLLLKLRDLFYTRRALRVAPDADVIVTNTFWAPVLARPRHGAIYVDVGRMPRGQMRFYRRASRLRANSVAVAEAIAAEAPELTSRIHIIPIPLPFGPPRPVNWSRKTNTVLFAGRLHPEKGLTLLLDAWESRRGTGELRDWTLEIVGPAKANEGGAGETWVRELRQRYPAADIIWRDPIYDPALLNDAYERARIFVYPSLARGETFGVAVLEGMAWGAVPVVSALACFKDFVVPGVNGGVFDHQSPAAVANLRAALVAAAGPKGRDQAERALLVRGTHSCSSIAERFLEDFARLQ